MRYSYRTNLTPDRAEASASRPVPRLTARQLDILTRIARGMTEVEIGAELFLTRDTVKTHARRAYRALGARCQAHAVALAYQAGILPLPSAPAAARGWTA
jgi:DNA-binding NarL/FixJ family response regulator